MDLARFEELARDKSRTREELESMKANALARGQTEHARIAEEVLRERFPVRTRKSGGATPTTAVFRGHVEQFDSGKDAYLWLVEQFRLYHSTVFDDYQALHAKARSAGSRFSRSPESLFPPGSKRAGDPRYYATLGGDWYADTNLNHQDKFSALLQLAYVTGLSYPADWDFRVEGGTKELVEQQRLVVRAREILNQLLQRE